MSKKNPHFVSKRAKITITYSNNSVAITGGSNLPKHGRQSQGSHGSRQKREKQRRVRSSQISKNERPRSKCHN